VKTLVRMAGVTVVGVGMLVAPVASMAALQVAQQNAPTQLTTPPQGPACDDVGAITAAVTAAIVADPLSAPTVAAEATARCPADAAAIATAAVSANPNQAENIVVAVLGALPESDQKNDVLTAAINGLAGQQSEIPPGLQLGIGGDLHAPFTAGLPQPTSVHN
jgi:hypothetical protein